MESLAGERLRGLAAPVVPRSARPTTGTRRILCKEKSSIRQVAGVVERP